LQREDVLKVDIGVHVRGRILDSAFTLTFEPTYDNLLEAVKAATNTGIRVFISGCWSFKRAHFITLPCCRKLESMRGLGRLQARYKRPWNRMKLRLGARSIPVCVLFTMTCASVAHIMSVKAIENLSGHSIELYKIHGNKSILLVKNEDQTKMEEGEYFAIETFGSTGRGRVVESVRDSNKQICGGLVDHRYDRVMFHIMPRYTMLHRHL